MSANPRLPSPIVERGGVLRQLHAGLAEASQSRRQVIFLTTARYAFQHVLYQQVAYERMGQVRQLQLHLRLGERLEAADSARAP